MFFPEPLDVQLASLLHASLEDAETRQCISSEEAAAIASTVAGLEVGELVKVGGTTALEESLAEMWATGLHPKDYIEQKQRAFWKALDEAGISPSIDISWKIGMSEAFIKSIEAIDKKTQGRILEAIGKICVAPTKPIGDTVKPLGGNMAGLWRYRIGDYRLIYQPEPNEKCVILIRFTPRGGAYE